MYFKILQYAFSRNAVKAKARTDKSNNSSAKNREIIRNNRVKDIEKRKILFTKSSDEFNELRRLTIT